MIIKELLSNKQDAIMYKCKKIWHNATSPALRSDALSAISQFMSIISQTSKRDNYISNFSAYTQTYSKQSPDAPGRVTVSDLTKYVKEVVKEREKKSEADYYKTQRENTLKSSNKLDPTDVGLPADFTGNINDAINYQLYEYEGRIWSKLFKGTGYADVSNFTMQYLYHIATDSDIAYRIVRVQNIFGEKKEIQLNTDDLVSAGSFKKMMARNGRFTFKGGEADLNRINEYLQKDETGLKMIDIMGYDIEHKFYAFGNGVLMLTGEKKFIKSDETGVVKTTTGTFYLPAFSSMYMLKRDQYKTEKNFVFRQKDSICFKEWSDVHAAVWGPKGYLAQLWLINSLFRDITFNNNTVGGTPILCLAGQPGSGKDTFSKGLLSIFGNAPSSINLGSQNSIKGFVRKFAQVRNGIVWLNEYKNNLDKSVIGAIKGIYDGDGYVRAQKSNDYQTDTTPINASCMLSGQDLPTIENALLSRTILCTFEKRENYSDVETQVFQKLQKMEQLGLSNVLFEILNQREHFEQTFDSVYARTLKDVYQLINDPLIDDRYIHTYALLLAMYECLKDQLQFPYGRDVLNVIVKDAVKSQYSISQSSNEVSKFWNIMEHLINSGIIRHGLHYRVKDGTIYVKTQDIYPFYVKEMRAQGDNTTLSQQALVLYFTNDKTTFIKYQKARIATKESTLMETRNSVWCHWFNYNQLCEKYNITLMDQRDGIDHAVTAG